MNWESCRFKHIAEKISDTDLNSMISVMIDNCDKYCIAERALGVTIENIINVMITVNINIKNEVSHIVDIDYFFKTHVKSPEFFTLIDETAKKEILREEDINWEELTLDEYDYYREECDLEEEYALMLKKEEILKDIIYKIAREAIRKRDERIYIRHKIGEHIDLATCSSHNPFNDYFEFYKDGGWGIADKNGIVIIRNHIRFKPSAITSMINIENCSFRIIQDIDTNLYGVLSIKSFKETINCLYDKIEIVKNSFDTNKHIIKVKKNDKWGCYNEDCSFIIDCKYDEIEIKSEWIEGSRDGHYLYPEINYNQYNCIYEGVRDLFDFEGNIIIGGYNHFEYDYKKHLKFYFGTLYERYSVQDEWLDYYLTKYKINYNNALCLVLDNHFRTLLQCNGHHLQIQLGTLFNSIQELKNNIPNGFLLSGYVDLSNYNLFIFLRKNNVDKYIVSNYIEWTLPNLSGKKKSGHWIDYFIEDDMVIIMRIGEDGNLLWNYKVNEIGKCCSDLYMYRIDDKVGFFSSKGVYSPLYAAITTDDNEGKTFVAQIQYYCKGKKTYPCFIPYRHYTINFLELTESGKLEKIRGIFNPKKYKWFPSNFIQKNSEVFTNNNKENMGTTYEGYNSHEPF